MEILLKIFGEGKDLNALQMSCRGIVIFFVALVLIRISGLVPVIVCCFVIVLMHRSIGWLIASYKGFGRFIEGEKILLFKNGSFLKENMKRALVCEEDLMQGVRKSALTEDMEKIDKVFMERNGDISAIRK